MKKLTQDQRKFIHHFNMKIRSLANKESHSESEENLISKLKRKFKYKLSYTQRCYYQGMKINKLQRENEEA